MKLRKQFLLLTSFCFSIFCIVLSCKKSQSGPSGPTDINLSKGLLAYFPFSGNMNDSSGNGNTVTVMGNASLTLDKNGVANSAFNGLGSGQSLVIANNGSIQFDTAITLSMDVLVHANTIRQSFFSMVEYSSSKSASFGFGFGFPNSALQLTVFDNTGTCGSFPSSTKLRYDSSQFIPSVETWYHLITIYQNGNIRMYVNGTLISSKTGAPGGVLLCSSANVIVGGWWSGDPITINGKLDNVRMYNRVLNADEIAALSKN
jgi:hypothetical protein